MAISFQLNKKDNKLFNTRVKGRWNYPIALLISLTLVFWDKHYPIYPLHQVFAVLTYPFQYTVNFPGHLIESSRVFWGTKQNILTENANLKQESLQLQADLQQFLMLKDENEGLRAMLSLAKHSKNDTKVAELLSFETTGTKQLIIINKGKKDGITAGQLVIDTRGVTGQVIEVGGVNSKVLLISDAASAVPVRNQRTAETAILIGKNNLNHLSLIHLPKTAKVKIGDILLTSGLGGKYPAGYPVGMVEKVETPPGEAFIQVDVAPFTSYHRNQFVLLVEYNDKSIREGKA